MTSGMTARTSLLGRSILLAEDDFMQARDTQQALQHAGARVFGPYGDSIAALRCLVGRQVSCAILDLRLSDGLNFGLASALQDKGIPIIFMTGLDPAIIPSDFGEATVLRKPVDYRALLAEASRLSGRRWN